MTATGYGSPPIGRLWLTLPLMFYMMVALGIAGVMSAAFGQEHHHPTETITGATAKFYETWMRPDDRKMSCCSMKDCYATISRHRGGKVQAVHRESGDWIDVPPEKVELDRDSPDGLSHICATVYKHVFCFKEGSGA